MLLEHRHGLRVLRLDDDGPLIGDAGDVVGDAFGHEATVVVVPVSRLDPEFFRLASGVAGEFLQKLVNYRIRLVVLGDVTPYEEASGAFRDLVREANRTTQTWFVPDETVLDERLGVAD